MPHKKSTPRSFDHEPSTMQSRGARVAQREQEPSLPAATAGAQTKEKARMRGLLFE